MADFTPIACLKIRALIPPAKPLRVATAVIHPAHLSQSLGLAGTPSALPPWIARWRRLKSVELWSPWPGFKHCASSCRLVLWACAHLKQSCPLYWPPSGRLDLTRNPYNKALRVNTLKQDMTTMTIATAGQAGGVWCWHWCWPSWLKGSVLLAPQVCLGTFQGWPWQRWPLAWLGLIPIKRV